MNSDNGFVVKDTNGFYYIGYGQFDNQLRKAKIYHSTRFAQEIVDDSRFKNKNLTIIPVIIKEA